MKKDNHATLITLMNLYIEEAKVPKFQLSRLSLYETRYQNKSKLKRLRLTMDEIMKEIEKE